MKHTRITVDPYRMGGVPCIRGLRIPVSTVDGMLAEGMSETEILRAYPDLDREDIREALCYEANTHQDPQDSARNDLISEALNRVNAQHGKTLRKLAD